MENDVVLSVRDLVVQFTLRGQVLTAIRGASLDLHKGESLAIVGESGSGKSVFTKTFMGMLDKNGSVKSGEILYDGMDLAKFTTEAEWLKIRGRRIAMVFQDPMTALSPLMTVGKQIAETLELHQGLKGRAAKQKAIEILRDVGITDPERRYKQYPHEFSGGMRQRVVIAIAVACNPEILICDEPTTALDVTIQAQILDLLVSLQKQLGTAVIMITHDLGVIAGMCSRVLVMYGGVVVEEGTVREIFYEPRHPYTWGLLRSIPQKSGVKKKLVPIPGSPPDLIAPPPGCPFAARCPHAMNVCTSALPEMRPLSDSHCARCYLMDEGAPKVTWEGSRA